MQEPCYIQPYVPAAWMHGIWQEAHVASEFKKMPRLMGNSHRRATTKPRKEWPQWNTCSVIHGCWQYNHKKVKDDKLKCPLRIPRDSVRWTWWLEEKYTSFKISVTTVITSSMYWALDAVTMCYVSSILFTKHSSQEGHKDYYYPWFIHRKKQTTKIMAWNIRKPHQSSLSCSDQKQRFKCRLSDCTAFSELLWQTTFFPSDR